MKYFILIISTCFFFTFSGITATVYSKKEHKLYQLTQTMANLKQYMGAKAETYTLEGFQAYLGRKLTAKERKIFKLYKATDPQTPEEEVAMLRNKKLAMWSMIMGIAGFAFLLIPYVSILSIFLFPAALITGIIALSNASKYENKKQSGFGNALAGTIIGGIGILTIFLAVLVFVAFCLCNFFRNFSPKFAQGL